MTNCDRMLGPASRPKYQADVKIADLPEDGKWEHTKKIGEFIPPCMDPNHYPPRNRVFSPGIYEHTCPSCGEVTRFTIPLITCYR